jgi:hypothetical protein
MNKKVLISMVAVIMLLAVGAQAGNFTDNGNGTVTDGTTGIMWQKEDDNTKRTWAEAGSYCEGLTLAGYSDWRLPDVNDLLSLIPAGDYTAPTIDETYFPNTDSKSYWSSRAGRMTGPGQIAEDPSKALLVTFSLGIPLSFDKTGTCHVRCVRGGR